jgi:hypothetical protein
MNVVSRCFGAYFSVAGLPACPSDGPNT